VTENSRRLVALLFVKGESVRVPDKNFRRLGDRPLFRWIVDTVLRLPSVDRLLINTDVGNRLVESGLPEDSRIRVQDRAPALCGNDVTANALLQPMVAAEGAERYLLVHATCPFLQVDTITQALTLYDQAIAQGTGDSLFGVTRHQTRFYTPGGAALNHDPARLVPTQDLEPTYEENSSLYIFSKDSFEQTGSRIGRRPVLFETPATESLDIDTELDWDRAVTHATGEGTV